MILLYIITSILYLIMIGFVLYLYYTYRKDYEELDKRILELEKRINECEHISHEYKDVLEILFEHLEVLNLDTYNKLKNMKESDNMACKKGRGGRKK